MQRRNYDAKSGVLIDVCADHGVWFDDDELAAILRWIRSGRSRLAKQHAEELRKERQRNAKPSTLPGTFPPMRDPIDGQHPITLIEILIEVAAALIRVLGSFP